jgi:DNA-binding transcriptional LysR family regulator
MNIDIRQLRYFRAVADERSFTRAAARLNMAQPPLSRRIQELEAEIGALLFERGQRPLRMTAVGHLLYEQASLVTEAMERLQAVVRQATERPRTRFTIAMVPSTLYARFPQIVARFRARFPRSNCVWPNSTARSRSGRWSRAHRSGLRSHRHRRPADPP